MIDKIDNEKVIDEVTKFVYGPNKDISGFCMQLFVESVVFDKAVNSYTIGHLSKAIEAHVKKNNIKFEADFYK